VAFLKQASAKVVKPSTSESEWRLVRASSDGFNKKAAASLVDFKKIIPDFDPDDYLLSHATIICSVDVEDNPKNDKGHEYRVTEKTQSGINSNFDAWQKKLLLDTYKTFIGAENYLEHCQIPELSKGKILDAVAREVGDFIYIDILVATNRKHKE